MSGNPEDLEQEMTDSARVEPVESSVRNIFKQNPSPLEFEEGPPRHRDPLIDTFKAIFAEAQQIEQQISAAEARLEQDVEPLRTRQVLLAFQASKLIAEDSELADVVDSLLLEAGHKPHGNEKIPCSPLMRAIVGQGEAKGTPRFKRKKQRATTYASAVDFAVQQGMSQEAFEAELRHPATPGERHGIEHLAKLGRKLRRGEPTESSDPPADMPFRVEGDVLPVPPGVHLMVYRVVPGEPTLGAPLTVPESLFRQVLAAHNKSTRSNHTG